MYCIVLVIHRWNVWSSCLHLVFTFKVKFYLSKVSIICSAKQRQPVIRAPAAAANTDKHWSIEETSPADIISTQTRPINHSLSSTACWLYGKPHTPNKRSTSLHFRMIFVFCLYKLLRGSLGELKAELWTTKKKKNTKRYISVQDVLFGV